jgi:hypothetical protein
MRSEIQSRLPALELRSNQIEKCAGFKGTFMRIWGYVLLILGIIFLLLFVMAAVGGAKLGIVPYFVSGFLILMGFRLRNSGRGLVQQKPAATAGIAGAEAAPGQIAASDAAEFSTVELPLTPEVAALLVRHNAHSQKILLYIAGGCIVFFAVLGVVIAATVKTPDDSHILLPLFGGIGLASACMICGISWLTTQRPVRKDLRGTTYLRTTGPVKVATMSGGGMLRLADRAFMMNGRNGMTELSKLGWGRVDYSPHGHVILGAWDKDGNNVYCLPGYSAGSGT